MSDAFLLRNRLYIHAILNYIASRPLVLDEFATSSTSKQAFNAVFISEEGKKKKNRSKFVMLGEDSED